MGKPAEITPTTVYALEKAALALAPLGFKTRRRIIYALAVLYGVVPIPSAKAQAR